MSSTVLSGVQNAHSFIYQHVSRDS